VVVYVKTPKTSHQKLELKT